MENKPEMYRKILIPTDGSKTSEKAVGHALNIAENFDSEVHILYVIDLKAMDLALGTEQVERIKQGRFSEMPDIKRRVKEATGRIAERAKERGLDAVEKIEVDTPYRKIVEYSKENDIDLIVMGSHGRSGFRRMILGSVSERVLRLSEIPVLIVTGVLEDTEESVENTN